jgi:hypothetical protein
MPELYHSIRVIGVYCIFRARFNNNTAVCFPPAEHDSARYHRIRNNKAFLMDCDNLLACEGVSEESTKQVTKVRTSAKNKNIVLPSDSE